MRLHLGCSDDLKSNYVNVDIGAPPAGSVDITTQESWASCKGAISDGERTYRTPEGFIYQRADLNSPWPWESSTVDEIVANDVFEHISSLHWAYYDSTSAMQPYGLMSEGGKMRACFEVPGKIWAMNEAHRVLKPGGVLRLTVPSACLGDGRINVGAFADPTHRSYWTFDDCFYFGEQWNTPDMERGRLGEAYGITALFRFPPMVDCGAKGWKVADYRGQPQALKWVLDDANGRAKLRGVLEAVK